MSKVLFIILNFFTLLLRTFLAIPIIVLRNFFPFVRKRLDFERKNIFNPMSETFARNKIKADYFFHLSSEGELEQCRPLIEFFLEQNKYLEICYTSDSVEDKCLKLYHQNSKFIRIYRLPILSFFPFNFLYFQSIFNFITAPKVIMCRYDFFPELILLKYFRKEMILVSAATKKMSWYKQQAIGTFDILIASTPAEKIILAKMYPKKRIEFFDFRIPRIFQRGDGISSLVKQNNAFKNLIDFYSNLDSDSKMIIGSCWESDLAIFQDKELIQKVKNKELYILIAPHKLNKEFVQNLKEKLSHIFSSELVGLYDGQEHNQINQVTITLVPGVLCEMYSAFAMAYIGGGYEKSIHSVLEPYLMGTKILVGPKIYRSTEYDFINSSTPNEIAVLKNPELFYNSFKQLQLVDKDSGYRTQLKNNFNHEFSLVVDLIAGKNNDK